MASAAIAATNYVYQQQSPDFIPNNQHNQQTGDNNSTLTFSPQQQQQNFIMIKQSNQIKCITHYHYHSNQSNNNNNSGQTISTTMPSIGSNSQTIATTIKIKNEDENDSFINQNNNYYYDTQGTPPSSSSSSSWSSRSSMDGDGQFLLDDNRDYMAEINHACKMLAISADPYNWNQTDVRKWLMYQQRLHQLQSFNLVVELGFPMDGMSLCELNIQDFHQRILNSMNNGGNGNGNIQTWNYAKILYQELNIWRNAITKMFEPDLAFFDSSTSTSNMIVEQQQQNYDQFPAIMNDNKSLMMFNPYNNNNRQQSPCSLSSSSPISSYCSSNYGDDCQQQMLFNYGSNNFMDGYQNDHTQSLSNTNHLLYNPSSNNSVYSNSPSSSPQRSLLSCSSPAGSISSAASSTSLANNNNYITNNHMQQQQFQQSSQQSVDHIIGLNQRKFPENSYTSYQQNVYGNVDHSGYQENIFSAYPQQQQIITSEYGSDDEIMSDDDPINGKCRVMISAVSSTSTSSSKTNSPLSTKTTTTTTTTKQSTFNGPRPHGSTTSIQLWQFLRELLSQPNQHENAIRWLERQRGVFKIEDSVRVARLWGERKNRPAMNYDKLSRSIRQYYKKGIMKKTERAQRLVYQFCQPYAL